MTRASWGQVMRRVVERGDAVRGAVASLARELRLSEASYYYIKRNGKVEAAESQMRAAESSGKQMRAICEIFAILKVSPI